MGLTKATAQPQQDILPKNLQVKSSKIPGCCDVRSAIREVPRKSQVDLNQVAGGIVVRVGWVQIAALAQMPVLPSLEQLLRGEPPITTSLNDAVTEEPFLDDFNPRLFTPISALSVGPNQGYLLRPGLFAFEAQSYCLNAGSYAPGKGDGYLYAPLKGSRAGVLASLLRRSRDHPEIAQHDIQALIWAILARSRLSDMPPRMLAVATQLLTPQELFEVNSGALPLIPESLLRQMIARLPEPIQLSGYRRQRLACAHC